MEQVEKSPTKPINVHEYEALARSRLDANAWGFYYGLAVNGAEGVAHVLEILRSELELAMALVGCPSIRSISRSLVKIL